MARRDDKANELVTITTAATVLDAEVICSALRAAGIYAFVPNENSSTMLPHMIGAINPDGVPVIVRSADAQAARAVLGGKGAPPPPRRTGDRAGPDRPGSRKDDRYAPPAGGEDDQAEQEAWGQGHDEDEEEGDADDYDDRYYGPEDEDDDEDESVDFDDGGLEGDEYAGDEEEGPPVDGRYDRWEGSPDGRDRDGRQRDGGERRTLKFDDYQDKDFRNSGKADRSDVPSRGEQPEWSDDEPDDEADDESDLEDYEDDEQEEALPETAADRYAAAAARSILFTWWCPPAALWTLYCICQAMQARQVDPPTRAEQFQGNLWCAVVAGLGSAVLASIVYYHILANW